MNLIGYNIATAKECQRGRDLSVHLCGRGPTGVVTSFKLLQILREVQCQLCYLLLGYPVLLAAQSKVYSHMHPTIYNTLC